MRRSLLCLLRNCGKSPNDCHFGARNWNNDRYIQCRISQIHYVVPGRSIRSRGLLTKLVVTLQRERKISKQFKAIVMADPPGRMRSSKWLSLNCKWRKRLDCGWERQLHFCFDQNIGRVTDDGNRFSVNTLKLGLWGWEPFFVCFQAAQITCIPYVSLGCVACCRYSNFLHTFHIPVFKS